MPPHPIGGTAAAFAVTVPLGFRDGYRFRGRFHPAYSLARLRIDAVVAFDAARLTTDLPVTLWSDGTLTRWTTN